MDYLKKAKPLKVLIVEPDVSALKALEADIKEWRYEVFTASNHQDALNAIKNNDEIRLVIIEWRMDGADAAELCREIRQQIKEQRTKIKYIILMANKNMEYDTIRGLQAGADDYIIKPFNSFQLKIRLQTGERIIQLEDNLNMFMTVDILTKLWNKSKIVEILEEELNRGWRESQPTSVIMVDIDYFKQINDTHGHFIGDKVLIEVAARFIKCLRPYDKAGRYGGDEMLIVVPNCDLKGLKQVAERLRNSIEEIQIKTEMESLNVTVSVGGAASDNLTRASGISLIQSSDKALYEAKKRGRNCSVVVEYSSLPPGEKQ